MRACVNFDRHRGPHHFHPGMDHFRGHHHFGGHHRRNFWHRGHQHPMHHRGPPGFPHAPPPYMSMGPNWHHHPHHCPPAPDHCRFQENRPDFHHCRRHHDGHRPQRLGERPSSCPPFGRPPFDNGPFEHRGRPHRRDRGNRDCGHCGNSSAAR